MPTTATASLPIFSTLNPATIIPELNQLLDHQRLTLKKLLTDQTPTAEPFLATLAHMQNTLHQFWSRVSHLNAVTNYPALREAYNRGLALICDYSTELSHNTQLYQVFSHFKQGPTFNTLPAHLQTVIEHQCRDFKLSGVHLDDAAKQTFKAQLSRLSALQSKFEENVLDATKQFSQLITDADTLSGIPQSALTRAQQRAEAEQKEGYLLTLETPDYLAIMMHAEHRPLRAKFYKAYATRASDVGAHDQALDNTAVIDEILTLRRSLAKTLGFSNAAEESLATKMADSCEQVIGFLNELAQKCVPKAQQEFAALSHFAKTHLNIDTLHAWDIAFASEKLRQHQHNISQEELRPYFAAPTVIDGLFEIIHRLFNVTFEPVPDADTWHDDVRCYAVLDHQQTIISYCYTDLYARKNKRAGAWMDDYQGRHRHPDGSLQIPIAFVTCNFNGPDGNHPALFTHDEVVTLFHEFGHALQHMLTTVDHIDVSGINGIPWDAVELPSQFLENWAWHPEALSLFARHYQTQEPLSKTLYERLNGAKNFQSAMQMVRQLEFALFDFTLHMAFNPSIPDQVRTILQSIRDQVAVVPCPDFNRFPHSFSHIFAGGYSAGYYSYKWAEVMSSDAFGAFLETSIFDKKTAALFLEHILQPGGTEPPEALYTKFRGRPPSIEALLHQSGIC